MRESFVLYTEYQEHLELLSTEELGILFKAIFAYQSESDLPEMNAAVKIAFSFIRKRMDADAEKYEEMCRKRAEAGRKGAEVTNKKKSANDASDDSEKRQKRQMPNLPKTKTAKTADNDFELDNDNDIKNLKSKSTDARASAEDRFEEFWVRYPKKVGKGGAKKSWNRIKPGKDLFEKILQALASQVKSAQWQEENGRFIPNPSTWLNQGRWDDELPSIRGKPTRAPTGTRFSNFEQREDDIDSIALAMMKKQMEG